MNDYKSKLLSLHRVVVSALFMQYGAQKLWGGADGRVNHDWLTLRGFAGPLEFLGGLLVLVGFGTRTAAFILCGEMAVAYFMVWAPHGFWPILNGGEITVLFCYVFLYFVVAGPGVWSFESLQSKRRNKQSADSLPRSATPETHEGRKRTFAFWEAYGRSILRIVFAFTFLLHGFRHAFGVFPVSQLRRGAAPMALDLMPNMLGFVEVAAGILLFGGLLTRLAAYLLSLETFVAYFLFSAPRGPWPILTGGNETLIYALTFLLLAGAGGGALSLDQVLHTRHKSRFVKATLQDADAAHL